MIYLATWVGPVAFYWSFQRKVLAGDDGTSRGRLIWHLPREVPPALASDWTWHHDGASGFPLPAGSLTKVEREGEVVVVSHDDGLFRVQRFPPGFIRFLFEQELRQVGAAAEGLVLSDVAVLHEVLGEVPGRYEFTWSAGERHLYAARLLSKLLLFENRPVRRVEISTRAEPLISAALVEYSDGRAKVVRAGPSGVLVVLIPETAPSAWTASAGLWLVAPPVEPVDVDHEDPAPGGPVDDPAGPAPTALSPTR